MGGECLSGTVKFLDLFAGAGGLSLGCELAGMKPVYAIECDKWAALSYRHNHPHVQVDERDISSFSDAEINDLRRLGAHIIVGGPPCQGFSHSNVVNRDPNDPRNTLFREFVRFVRILRPTAFVIENVPGLLRAKTASKVPVIEIINQAFVDIGYSVDWRVLEASDFGVPQLRQRLFIVGFRDAGIHLSWPSPTHRQSSQYSLFGEAGAREKVTLWDAICDLPQITSEDEVSELNYIGSTSNEFQAMMRADAPLHLSNHEPMRHTARIVERFSLISFGSSEADVPHELKPRRRGSPTEISGKTYDQNSRRQRPDQICSTIVASSHTNFIHPFLDRNFTVREMMRVQSFPDRYILLGKRAVLSKKLSIKKGLIDDIYLDQRAQVGNAVPPLLGKAIAEVVGIAIEGASISAA